MHVFRNLTMAALLAPVTATAAWADDCDVVSRAFSAFAAASAYHETISVPDGPKSEVVMIGDTLYLQQAQGWQKVDLPPDHRALAMKRFAPAALKDCSRVGASSINGEAATIYLYTPPPPGDGATTHPQKVWISDRSGLPLRMTADRAEIDVDYEAVKPPVP